MKTEQNHEQIYAQAAFYDIAFDYRNIAAEVDFLLQLAQVQGQEIHAILELAAGPAQHALAFAQRQYRACALDLSAEMVAYGLQLAQAQSLELDYFQADMCDFRLKAPVDLAMTMIDSASYLLTQADFLAHLKAVYEALRPGGLYVLEMAHPRDLLSPAKTVSTSWQQERDGVLVEMQWGQAEDLLDPITQITQVHVHLKVQQGDQTFEFKETAAQRVYTWPELQLLFHVSPLQLCQVYGAFDINCKLEDEKAWRTISVLQRPF